MAVYAFSDLHGQYDLWKQIENFIKPEDTVYCLGDCADRGPDGWKIIKEIMDTPNIIYIRGNHEQFIVEEDYCLWHYNGGAPTITDCEAAPEEEYKRVKEFLKKTSLIENYINEKGETIALCHAGFDPKMIKYKDDEDLFWDRNHIRYEWPSDAEWYSLKIIHGHTPIQYMKHFTRLEEPMATPPQAYWYADGHKCCIDQGSFMSGNVLLLDLDTFEEHIFTAEVEKYEV